MHTVSRRSFIKNTGGAGIALWLGISNKSFAGNGPELVKAEKFTPYILVESNGNITLFNIKPEMGQGTFQSIPALLAEEFEVSLDQVIIKLTNGEKEFGNRQSAGGSSSVRSNYMDMRKMGAAAREVFITAAATRWKVAPGDCYASNGKVFHSPSKQSFGYGELVADAAKLELPKEPKLKDPKDFKIIGKPANRPDIPLKTNGSAQFGLDMQVPGMLYASVERCPVLGGTLKSFDATEALKMPGVKKVIEAEKQMGKFKSVGVAVVANSYWAATQARKKLQIVWDTKGFETFNSEDYENHLRSLENETGIIDKNIGSVDGSTISPENSLEAFYETPVIAHHTLEPMNCIAQVKGDKLEIWTSTQVPSSITGSGDSHLAKQVGFAPDNIKLNNAFIGGGFGRRLYIDYIIEAVNIAKHFSEPVKLIWSREDTTQQGPFRPMTFSKFRASLSPDGKLASFQHKVIAPSLRQATSTNWDTTKIDTSMVEGISEQAYEIPNLTTSFVRADCHFPLAAWRSVTSSTLAFAQECFLDEMAYIAKKDPLDFRLSMLSKPSDLKRVLLKLRELSGWDKKLPAGKGKGIAAWEFFAGLCGHVVEVSYQADRSIKIDRVVAVMDLGEVVNPDMVKAQVEGAMVMALGAATKPGISFKNGVVTQHNFYDSLVPRIYEIPPIEVHILTEGGKIKGVGEPGLPPFAPALANAIYAATGKRLRRLPFDLNNI